jgi:hypothetical protein
LLDILPSHSRSANSAQSVLDSPGGWSDLPSDSEDTFFFSPEEAEDFRREKRRRLLDQNREERLRARRIEDGESSEADDEDMWGGSDEEVCFYFALLQTHYSSYQPDDSQRELMRRTAQHLLSSPNPAQLEMRILANHGNDKKFAFLRGRWSHAWMIVKGKTRREKEEHEKDKVGSGLGVLAGYGDSDESEDDVAQNVGDTVHNSEAEGDQDKKVEGENQKPMDDESIKVARRARAKEWAEKRRARASNS